MPVKSVAQERFLGMRHPDVLRDWKAEGASTSTKGLPYRAGKKGGHKGPLGRMFGGAK